MNIVENTVERIHLPAGLVLNVRPSSPGAVGTIALAGGSVTLAATSTSGTKAATVGPFAVPVDLAVNAQGTVSAEVAPLTAAQAQGVAQMGVLYLPGEDVSAAAANLAAIRAQLASTGSCIIASSGRVWIDGTIEPASGQYLQTLPGCKLARRWEGRGMVFHMVRNWFAESGVYPYNLAINSGRLTVPEPGHNRQVGETIYLRDFLGTTLNGPQQIVAVVPGVSWTIAASGSNPTNTQYRMGFVSRYNPMPGSVFTHAAGVVTVLQSGHKRMPGDRIYVQGITGDTAINGPQVLTAVVPGVSWSYEVAGDGTPGGTAQVLGDYDITYDVEFDGNYYDLGGVATQNGTHASMWVHCSRLKGRIANAVGVRLGRAANHNNVTAFYSYAAAGDRTSVCLQFDGLCDARVDHVHGHSDLGDDVLAWGVTEGGTLYEDTLSPVRGNMGRLVGGDVTGYSPTGLFKMYCTSGYDLGHVAIGQIVGEGDSAGATIGDPANGTSGGSFKSLTIGLLDAPKNIFVTNAWSAVGQIEIGTLYDNAVNAAAPDATPGPRFWAAFDHLHIGRLITRVVRTTTAMLSVFPRQGMTVASGGSGYAANDLISLSGGTGVKALIRVVGVGASGAITSAVVEKGGWYYGGLPSNPVAQSQCTGSGTGATFNLTHPAQQTTIDSIYSTMGGTGAQCILVSGGTPIPLDVGTWVHKGPNNAGGSLLRGDRGGDFAEVNIGSLTISGAATITQLQSGSQPIGVNGAGTGFAVGNVVSTTGGTGTAAQCDVIAVKTSNGAIVDIIPRTAGYFSVNPANPVTLTGGSGSGASWQFAFANIVRNINIGILRINGNIASGFGGDGTGQYNVRIGTLEVASGVIANNLFQGFYFQQTYDVKIAQGQNPSGKWILTSGNAKYRIDARHLAIDLGNPVATPAWLQPQEGDMVRNLNATTKGLYGFDGTNWVKVF
jgi:hypothetical protein